MLSTIIIQIEEVGEGKFNSDVAIRGDIHLLARAIAAGMQKEPNLRNAIIEAIDNMLAGYQFDITDRDRVQEGGEKAD